MDFKINIPDSAYKFGCGRYLQGRGILESAGGEILRSGKAPLVIGGPTALSLVREKLTQSFDVYGIKNYGFIEYTGHCCAENAAEIMKKNSGHGAADVIVGAGGGRIMDLAKLCGYIGGLPVVNIPTSSATCAAVSSISVLYSPEGKTVGTLCYEREISTVIADLGVIQTQPERLAAAGIIDAISKHIEIAHHKISDAGLAAASAMAFYTYDYLIKNKYADPDGAIYACVPLTGVISGLSRGRHQSALAHELYENARRCFTAECASYMHGELVGIGLFMQLAYDGRADEIDSLREYMRSLGMPLSLSETGIPSTDGNRKTLFNTLLKSEYLDKTDAENKKLKYAMEFLW